jgi:hypothetical protein
MEQPPPVKGRSSALDRTAVAVAVADAAHPLNETAATSSPHKTTSQKSTIGTADSAGISATSALKPSSYLQRQLQEEGNVDVSVSASQEATGTAELASTAAPTAGAMFEEDTSGYGGGGVEEWLDGGDDGTFDVVRPYFARVHVLSFLCFVSSASFRVFVWLHLPFECRFAHACPHPLRQDLKTTAPNACMLQLYHNTNIAHHALSLFPVVEWLRYAQARWRREWLGQSATETKGAISPAPQRKA